MPFEPLRLEVREKRCPLWALSAPGAYLAACLLAVRMVFVERMDVGVTGLLVAAGLVPAFAIPAVFVSRRASLVMTGEGLTVDGSPVKVDDARIERAERGSGVVHIVLRGGSTRSFLIPSYKDGERLIAMLPPVSAPAGALAA